MLSKLKSQVRELRAEKAGRRFRRYHRRHNHASHRQPFRRTLYIVLGGIMIVAGFLLSLPPGVPGFLLWIPGLAVVASQVHAVARLLDRAEAGFRRWVSRRRGGA